MKRFYADLSCATRAFIPKDKSRWEGIFPTADIYKILFQLKAEQHFDKITFCSNLRVSPQSQSENRFTVFGNCSKQNQISGSISHITEHRGGRLSICLSGFTFFINNQIIPRPRNTANLCHIATCTCRNKPPNNDVLF